MTEIIISILTSFLTGGFASAVVSYIISRATIKKEYDDLFAKTVSENRMEWINVWRENVSRFLAIAESINDEVIRNNEENPVPDKNDLERLYFSKNMILSRLNLSENNHILIMNALNNLNIYANKKTFNKQKETILFLAREILKPEWERVKQEAKGEHK